MPAVLSGAAFIPPFNPTLEFLNIEIFKDVRTATIPTIGQDVQHALKILESTHPEYDKMIDKWNDYLNWYTGDNIEDYIYQHVREPKRAYDRRKQRAFYFNYVGSIVDLISSFIYSKDIIRTASMAMPTGEIVEDPDLSEFWKDVDRNGTNIDEFMKQTFIFSQIFGHIDVFVDMPVIPEGVLILTEADRQAIDLRPYLYFVLPIHLTNWQRNDRGDFLWARWREKITPVAGPWDARGDASMWRYTTWTIHGWWIHLVQKAGGRSTVDLLGAGANSIGVVPMVRFFGKKDVLDNNQGRSSVSIIGKINVSILNWSSLIDEELFQKCLNILVMEESATEEDEVKIGNNNVLLWSGDHPPFYLAPASSPGEFMLKLIEHGVDEILRLSGLGADTGVREAKSGVALGFEFNQTNRMLADKASLIEKGEINLHKVRSQWLGEEWKGTIDYPETFNVETFEDEITKLEKAKKAVRSPTFRRLLEKRLADKLLTKLHPAVRDQIMSEIDTLEAPTPALPPGAPSAPAPEEA